MIKAFFLDQIVAQVSRSITPFRHFLIVTVAVFAAEFLIMYLLEFLRINNYLVEAVLDATLLSLIVSSFSYLLLTRPLLHTAKRLKQHESELTRHMENMEFTNQAFERQAEFLAHLAEEIEVKRAREEYLSLHDPLTGLPNRTLFWRSLGQAVAAAREEGTWLAVFYLDLNRFKQVNDRLGHDRGDELLKEVATRLGQLRREADLAARLGGDEFAILVPMATGESRADLVVRAEFIRDSLAIEVEGAGQSIQTGASIGIALFPEWDSVEDLVKNADRAMLEGKAERKGRIVFAQSGAASAA
jgi:diguanylate cyclase (GGDEF)-like protein